MKLEVIRGFLHPFDKARKSGRFGVVLNRVDGFVLIAPTTSAYERIHSVPQGLVLLSNKSESYKVSGFNVENVLISLRDMVVVREDSAWLEGAKKVGVLDLTKDKRLAANFEDTFKKFPPQRQVD